MSVTPADQDARDRIAADHGSSLFVDAGAGSGKTRELVQRVVAIIAAGYLESVRGLAAITFTENAAAELRTRLREALEDAVTSAGATGAMRERCATALTELDDAAITTLHGFAARLLADAPLEAGLPPGFGVQDEVATSIEEDSWWHSLLDGWYADETLAGLWRAGLTLGLNPTRLTAVLTAFNSNWDLLTGPPVATGPVPAPDAQPVLAPLRRLASYAGGRGPAGDPLARRVDEVLIPLLREASEEADALQVLALMKDAPLRDAGSAAAWDQARLDKRLVTGLLGEVRAALESQLAACREVVTAILAERLRQAVLAHAVTRRDRGQLWFHDLLVYAVRLLREDAAVRAAMQRRWRVLYVDEFQDTDPLQVQLVHLIAGTGGDPAGGAGTPGGAGGRLFFVGDPKQSIYRFRRADVALFGRVRDGYGDDCLSLSVNFRSRPGVLAVVNAAFRELLRGDQQAEYQELRAARPGVPGDMGPDVLLLGGPSGERIADIREREADHIAATLAGARGSWQAGGGPVPARPAAFGDMAILVPTRASLGQLEDALDRHGVPYRVMSRSLVWQSDAVRDMVTVLQAVDDPADEVALVAALRHPMFGCSDDDLARWRAAGGPWRYDVPGPEAAAGSPVAAALAALRRYHDLRWWLPVNVLLGQIIAERRTVELTAAHRRPRDHWRRLRFLADAARMFLDNGGTGLTSFVRWAREQIERAADAIESVIPERDDDAVQILTIHGAKGLEFPIVALTGLNAPPPAGAQVIWPGGGPPEITLHKGFSTAGFAAAQQAEKSLDGQEAVRLLYVGMTRAADHLIVSLHHHQPKNGRVSTHAGRLFAMREALTGAGAVHGQAAGQGPGSTGPPPEGAGPLPDGARTAAAGAAPAGAMIADRDRFLAARGELLRSVAARLPTTATGLAEAAADGGQEPADPLESASAAAAGPARPPAGGGATLGSAVHRALEIVDFAAADGPAAGQAVSLACAELGVPHIAGQAHSLVRAALGAPLLRLAAGRRHWKEVPVVAELGGRIVEGFIDLVVETDEGLAVVDYKTDAVSSQADIEAKARYYAPQIRAYAAALALATGQPAAVPQLLFCRPGGAIAVPVP